MPANGMRFSPIDTAVLLPESVSHRPATAGLPGTEIRSRVSAVIRSTEKTMPAIAAARGVRSALLAALLAALLPGALLAASGSAGASVMALPSTGRCPPPDARQARSVAVRIAPPG